MSHTHASTKVIKKKKAAIGKTEKQINNTESELGAGVGAVGLSVGASLGVAALFHKNKTKKTQRKKKQIEKCKSKVS